MCDFATKKRGFLAAMEVGGRAALTIHSYSVFIQFPLHITTDEPGHRLNSCTELRSLKCIYVSRESKVAGTNHKHTIWSLDLNLKERKTSQFENFVKK